MKKFAGDIIILHVYQKSKPYDLQFLRCGVRQSEFFVILGHFLSFYHNTPFPPPNPLPPLPLMIPKIQILKQNWKKCLEILSFCIYMCIINEDHMIYGSWNIRCHRQVILGHFLPFQPSENPENQNFRIKKNTWKYYHFKNVYHKWQS